MRIGPGIAVGVLGLGLLISGCGSKQSSSAQKSKTQASSSTQKSKSSKSSTQKSKSPTSKTHSTTKSTSQSAAKEKSSPTAPSTSGTKTQTGNPTGNNAQAAAFFQQKCQVCHGPGGAGASAPKLDVGMKSRFHTQAALQAFIQKNMPFNNPGSLTSAQASALARYIWSMQAP